MLVWRIEHKTIKGSETDSELADHPAGPWRDLDPCEPLTAGVDHYAKGCGLSRYEWNKLPTPGAEGLRLMPWTICACVSPAQLARWFPDRDGLAAMERCDYVLRSYDVPEIAMERGEHQVVFDFRHARPIEELPPTRLPELAQAA